MGRRDQTTCSVSAQAGRTSPGAEHALLYGGGELRMRLEGGALWRCPRGGADDSDFAICSGAESSPLEHRGRAQVSVLLRVSEACDEHSLRTAQRWLVELTVCWWSVLGEIVGASSAALGVDQLHQR